MRHVFLDSACWFEYLDGSSIGKKVHDMLCDDSIVFIFTTTHLAEIISKVERGGKDVQTCHDAVCSHVMFVPISTQLAHDSGLLHARMRKKIANFGLADAIALCVADEVDAHIFTTDSHFKGLKRTTVLS